MPRRNNIIITASCLAIAASFALTACQQSDQHKDKPTMPPKAAIPMPKPMVTQKAPIAMHPTAARLLAPEGPYILVVDASEAQLHYVNAQQATLTVPLHDITQVGHLYTLQEDSPHYYTGGEAQTIWQHSANNIFAHAHAVLSSNYIKPHAVKIISEGVVQNNLVFQLSTFKPFNHSRHLRNAVLNINGSYE